MPTAAAALIAVLTAAVPRSSASTQHFIRRCNGGLPLFCFARKVIVPELGQLNAAEQQWRR
eukprot:364487-Chlamydomonas_euryale.AAC.4